MFRSKLDDTDLEGVSCVVGASELGVQILKKMDQTSVLKSDIKFSEVTAAQSYGEIHHLNKKRRKGNGTFGDESGFN